jgi:AhpD family alkylhydroperoxidase
MERKKIENEIKETLGIIPSMFNSIPDSLLGIEWEQFKKLQLEEGPIPNKYRELIGIGIAAATKCRYCAYYHTEVAKLFGATDEEIQNALHFAKNSSAWSTYLNGSQTDFNTFKTEIDAVCEHVRSMQAETV